MTKAPDGETVLVVRRTISVPREQVFAAWLDPLGLARWMCPGDAGTATADVDARVGGTFRIVMNHGGGSAEHTGEYLSIDPPSRLSFTWISDATNGLPTVVTVEFLERGGGTELVLTHRRLPPDRIDDHRDGWTGIVRKLDDFTSRRL
jgi:uncharacterized protein YndB with AHSA1/START domain